MNSIFTQVRNNIIGINQQLTNIDGVSVPLIYADWTASGRCYLPIEQIMQNKVMPLIANTHTDTNTTGKSMTMAYHKAKQIIKDHVNANKNHVLIACGTGMTGAVNKLQRILGLKLHEKFKPYVQLNDSEKPVVFVTHMEHHSNQTSWLETIAKVIVIPATQDGLVDVQAFENLVIQYKNNPLKIAAITACSNVTGIGTPYFEMAKIIHKYNGLCFVDFACNAPYVDIDMSPSDPECRLDAIYFSPHKFLGGPGSTGILIFDKNLYKNQVPDQPGGGTVEWTNPWGKHQYLNNVEEREDGGTPGFLQTIRVAYAIQLKEYMGTKNILEREHHLMQILWDTLLPISNLKILAAQHKNRLGIISFYIENLNYNLAVKILNDKFGIQLRGGCSCAGTYGHYLFNVGPEHSEKITCKISNGDYSEKPGWIRLSIHPTMTDEEVTFIANCIKDLAANFEDWKVHYNFILEKNEIHAINNELENQVKHYVDDMMLLPMP